MFESICVGASAMEKKQRPSCFRWRANRAPAGSNPGAPPSMDVRWKAESTSGKEPEAGVVFTNAVSKPLSETAQLLLAGGHIESHSRLLKGVCFSAEEETSHANDAGFDAGRSGAVGYPSKCASWGAASLARRHERVFGPSTHEALILLYVGPQERR